MVKLANIDIDPKMAIEYAEGISKNRKIIEESLNILNKEIESISDVWRDSAEEHFYNDARKIFEKTQDFMLDLKAYSAFLKKTAGEYTDVEKKINKNINSFK